jgi:hypothetical protein
MRGVELISGLITDIGLQAKFHTELHDRREENANIKYE